MSVDCDYQLIVTEETTELVITAPTLAFLEVEATGLPGAPGADAPGIMPIPFGRMGTQFVDVGTQRFYIEYDGLLLGFRGVLASPPVGDDFIMALRVNGTVVATATILDGEYNSGYVTITPGTVSAGDYVTFDVTQVGSTSPGATLTVGLWMKVTI